MLKLYFCSRCGKSFTIGKEVRMGWVYNKVLKRTIEHKNFVCEECAKIKKSSTMSFNTGG